MNKLNLAQLNKKKEDITNQEMIKTKAGAADSDNCECDNLGFTYQDNWETDNVRECGCSSIWNVIGNWAVPLE